MLAPHPVAGAGDVEAGHRRPAARRPQQRGEDPHGGGLAGAVGAEQPAHAALRHRQVEAVQRGRLAAESLNAGPPPSRLAWSPLRLGTLYGIVRTPYGTPYGGVMATRYTGTGDPVAQHGAALARRRPATAAPACPSTGSCRGDRDRRRRGDRRAVHAQGRRQARRRRDVPLHVRAGQGRADRPHARPGARRAPPGPADGGWRPGWNTSPGTTSPWPAATRGCSRSPPAAR